MDMSCLWCGDESVCYEMPLPGIPTDEINLLGAKTMSKPKKLCQ
jgi:hypothetical protein